MNFKINVFQKSFHIKNVRKIALDKIKKLQEESNDCEVQATLTANGSSLEMNNIKNTDNHKDNLPNGTE